MAAEAATDPKVSVGHLRNVERLDDEIEALRSALEALPSKADQRSAEQAVEMGFDWGDGDGDDEQTRVFDAAVMTPSPAARPAAPLAKPVIGGGVSPVQAPPQPPVAESSSPFGRLEPAPHSSDSGLRAFDEPPSGPIDLDLPHSGMRRVSTFVLVGIVLSAIGAALWYAFEPPAQPVKRESTAAPMVIEAAPVPSDAQQR